MKTWTRMLCSVQWCIGENDTTCGSFIWRKENSASDWDRYPATTSGDGPVVVIGDQHVLAEDLLFQRGAGAGVDAPGQAQVFGLVAGQLPGDDPPHPGLAGDLLDLGLHLVPAAAGLAAGQGGGQLVEFLAGLGQRGAVEPAGLAGMQFRGVGQDRAPPGAVDLAAGVVGGQPAEPVLVDEAAPALAGRAVRSGQSLAGTDPM